MHVGGQQGAHTFGNGIRRQNVGVNLAFQLTHTIGSFAPCDQVNTLFRRRREVSTHLRNSHKLLPQSPLPTELLNGSACPGPCGGGGGGGGGGSGFGGSVVVIRDSCGVPHSGAC
jgi:hypothetical protein